MSHYYGDYGKKEVKPEPMNIMYDVATKRLEKSEIDNYIESLAKTSEYKRFMYRIITGKVWRGSNKELEANLNRKVKNIEQFNELKRGSAGDFKLVINEFKELLEEKGGE